MKGPRIHFCCRALDVPAVEKSPVDSQGVIVNRWHPVAPGASQVQNGLSSASAEMFPWDFYDCRMFEETNMYQEM